MKYILLLVKCTPGSLAMATRLGNYGTDKRASVQRPRVKSGNLTGMEPFAALRYQFRPL